MGHFPRRFLKRKLKQRLRTMDEQLKETIVTINRPRQWEINRINDMRQILADTRIKDKAIFFDLDET